MDFRDRQTAIPSTIAEILAIAAWTGRPVSQRIAWRGCGFKRSQNGLVRIKTTFGSCSCAARSSQVSASSVSPSPPDGSVLRRLGFTGGNGFIDGPVFRLILYCDLVPQRERN